MSGEAVREETDWKWMEHVLLKSVGLRSARQYLLNMLQLYGGCQSRPLFLRSSTAASNTATVRMQGCIYELYV